MDSHKEILHCLLNGKFKRMDCPQCENTFLTNVYSMECLDQGRSLSLHCANCRQHFLADTTSPAWQQYVLLEKYALGLEYFCDAIRAEQVKCIPFIRRIGVLDENNCVLDPDTIQLFTQQEPDYRIIYIMERLEHLPEEDVTFFTEYVHNIDWMEEADRQRVWGWIRERYGEALAEDIRKLCRYYREHADYIAWDLHGDNLMRRLDTHEIVVMDPFLVRASEC